MALGENSHEERGAGPDDWGEAFTTERGAGLAREPGRTL